MARRTILRRVAPTLVVAGLALAALAAPAQATVFGPRAGHSPNADDIRTAYWVAIAIAALLVIAVHAFLIAAIVRFRARRGRAPRRFGAGPGAFLRPAAPLVAVAVGTFVFGIVHGGEGARREVHRVPRASLRPAAWSPRWAGSACRRTPSRSRSTRSASSSCGGSSTRAAGPATGSSPTASSCVPVDTAVVLHVTSTDVMHRWFIPALGGQVDAVPGDTAETWFRADREGVYPGQSTFFSGQLLLGDARLGARGQPRRLPGSICTSRSGATSPRPRGTSARVTQNDIPGLSP